jgi:3',5'-cyclic AMP phosphodiesterase CpdA
MKIAHVSDLHLTGPHFVAKWGNNLAEILSDIKPEILVLTGDFTDDGYIHEYDLAREYIDGIPIKNKIVIPGNHDARNRGYKTFEEMFRTRFPFYENDQLVILGLDSTEPDIDDGHIGRENYDIIRKKMSVSGKLKIVALHHHLVPIPGTGRERNILVDAGEVLNLCRELNVNFVLSGHKHLPWIWKLGDIYLITAGTATSRRLKGRSYPSFNVIEIDHDTIAVNEVDVSQKSSRQILAITHNQEA